ncbi:MAG: DUF401 family protein [Tissierellaceae bacterium]|nr:DUF401 family protein [Tissierellaceae bacterium]
MEALKLLLVFIVIMVVMGLRRPLYVSIASGILATIILYRVNIVDGIKAMYISAVSLDTLYLILAFYTITFLQRMLEDRNHLILAEKSLSNLFNSRRINTMVAPFVIGMLPSPGAVLIAGPIVDKAGEDYVTTKEKAFITTYYRHISESFMPTYAQILLAVNLSGINMTYFVLGMIPLVFVLFILGYIFYVRKIPKETGLPESKNKKQDIINIFISLWSIALTTIIILIFNIQVYLAVIPVAILSILLNKFTWQEIKPMFATAFDTKLALSTIVIMMFKGVISYTGIIENLPVYFAALPIHSAFIFALIFLFGTIVAGSQAMVAIAIPLAFATIPYGGLALLILLMSMSYIASQISPTHICLAIVTEDFGISFIDLVMSTMPILISFVIISIIYSYAIFLLF